MEGKHHCLKCKKTFDEPELITYHACPHCHAKIEEEQTTGCQYWFGYLYQKE
jgi:Zn finger protein HypA/HybF involved in hydrogenase expression